MPTQIALIGDYSPEVVAHRAIPVALGLARAALGADFAWRWVQTRDISNASRDLADFNALWVVPASPYENTAGALDAIRFARETRRPFLGTCGGFQHALVEFARNVAGLRTADHAENNPNAPVLVITRLACSLVEQGRDVHFASDSLARAAYGRDTAHVSYQCNYGFNVAYRAPLEAAGLHFTTFDDQGEIRAAELHPTVHPFFVGTLFQSERLALRGELPPLVRAFASAAAKSKIFP